MKNVPVNPTQNFARNLTKIRQLQGMSQEDLAKKAELTRQTIIKYEKGETDPSISLVSKLADVLGIPFSEFFQANYQFKELNYGFKKISFEKFEKVNYRLGEELGEESEKELQQMASEKLKLLLRLEDIMEQRLRFKNPVKHLHNISTKEKAEEAALEVRKKWNLFDNPFANVIGALEQRGISVIEVSSDTNFQGFSAFYLDLPVIVLNSEIDEVTRKRFTALHELGHLILQIPDGIQHDAVERICDAFASMLLLPKELLIIELGANRKNLSLEELNRIKEKYGISILAILVSSAFSKIIPWKKYHEIKGEIEESSERISKYYGKEIPTRFEQLLYTGIMEDKIDKPTLRELVGDEALFEQLKPI
jgi:Zn-dependent peptidase ImmA (M78 family)/DNA-binding XRE family transcriptional regulator